MAPNMPEYAVVFHAVAMAGGIITTINPTYTEAEVRDQLQDSGAPAAGDHPAAGGGGGAGNGGNQGRGGLRAR